MQQVPYDSDLCGHIASALKGLAGYGAMAFELIQNADDAKASSVSFTVTDEYLLFENNSLFTSCDNLNDNCKFNTNPEKSNPPKLCNFHALKKMGAQSKLGQGTIGRFGIGFVSVYQITDAPIVTSGTTTMTLNPSKGVAEVRSIPYLDKTKFEFPFVFESTDVRRQISASPAPIDVGNKLITELCSAATNALMFLRHVSTIKVFRGHNNLVQTVSIERTNSSVKIFIEQTDQIPTIHEFLIFSASADHLIHSKDGNASLVERFPELAIEDRNSTISVAIQKSDVDASGLYFAFLPTQAKTELPLSINGDFFPHADRKHIVTEGEGKEKFWNDTLIEAAATTIADNILIIRDRIGWRIWNLIADAKKLSSANNQREIYWTAIKGPLKTEALVYTSTGAWAVASVARRRPVCSPEGIEALETLGISLLHPELSGSKHADALKEAGLRELSLEDVLDRVSIFALRDPKLLSEMLPKLWPVIDNLIQVSSTRINPSSLPDKIRRTRFLLDSDGGLAAPIDIYVPLDGINIEYLRSILVDCRFLASEAHYYKNIAHLVPVLDVDAFASEFSERFNDNEAMQEHFNKSELPIGDWYKILLAFCKASEDCSALESLPILKSIDGWAAPQDAQLAGGFEAPKGVFEILDHRFLDFSLIEQFKGKLGVKELTLVVFLSEHLTDSHIAKLDRPAHLELLRTISQNLQVEGMNEAIERIKTLKVLRVASGQYVQPNLVLLPDTSLEVLFDGLTDSWLDTTWYPSLNNDQRLYDFLHYTLGAQRKPTAANYVTIIQLLAAHGYSQGNAEKIERIIEHCLDNLPDLGVPNSATAKTLSLLSNVGFLRGERGKQNVTSQFFKPNELFRVTRASGFETQVTIVAATRLRLANAQVNQFLEVIGMPTVPKPEIIVNHILHLIEAEQPIGEVSYQLLNEALNDESRKEEAEQAVSKLAGYDCIYSGSVTPPFLNPSRVFWQTPPIGGYWFQAPEGYKRIKQFFDRVGVKEAPTLEDFLLLAEYSAQTEDLGRDYHEACIKHLCDAMAQADRDDSLSLLKPDQRLFLLSHFDEVIAAHHAVWPDSERLAEFFEGGELNGLLHRYSLNHEQVQNLLRTLNIRRLTDIAQLELFQTDKNEPLEKLTERLRGRANLLCWLTDAFESRGEISSLIRQIEVIGVGTLLVRAVRTDIEGGLYSKPQTTNAFYDRKGNALYLKNPDPDDVDWTGAVRTLFEVLFSHAIDADRLKALAMAGDTVLQAKTDEIAEIKLKSAGYSPPPETEYIAPSPSLLTDLETENEGEFSELRGLEEDQWETEPSVDLEFQNSSHEREQVDFPSDTDHEGNPFDVVDAVDPHDDLDAEYSSKGDTAFGATRTRTVAPETGASIPSKSVASQHNSRLPHRISAEDRRERQQRATALRSYVAAANGRSHDDLGNGGISAEERNTIDLNAIQAAIRYESDHGREAEPQAHSNPGFDILSRDPLSGDTRFIEVKGLAGDWTPRGVRLSDVQFRMAQEKMDQYWIYIVENTKNVQEQKLHAIRNPFDRIEEFWFDDGWKTQVEETIAARELYFKVGDKVRHKPFGDGTILRTVKQSDGYRAEVDFGSIEGKKFIRVSDLEPLN